MQDSTTEKDIRKRNIRLTVLIISVIIVIAAIISCVILLVTGRFRPVEKKDYTAHEITEKIIRSMNYENLSEISAENISKYYEIPDGVISDSCMYISSRQDNFTEIACFRLRTEDSETTLMKSVDSYLNEKVATYQNVNDKAFEAVSNSRILKHFPYVLVSVSADNDSVETVFETMFSPDTSGNLSPAASEPPVENTPPKQVTQKINISLS